MVDKSRSRQQGGAGLGLPLVQKIIGLHSGEMEIRSTAGEGTKILVMIGESTVTEGA
ncbi:Signal transduction histidine-protein kinase ArlS [compost metagenome]